ncbi:MAG TPA: glycosyltransferase family 9 protein [Bdellovibrionota bacterium]|nr:glycosyltransferase family 9 protein [Bdellovibrionota bacterium]
MAVVEASTILVRAPNWIGDQIMALPFFHYLRKAHPRARITVACVPWVEDLQFRHLVDSVVALPRPAGQGLRAKITALDRGAQAVRAEAPQGFDLGISLPNSLSAAWLLWRAGAKNRIGYKADGRGILLSDARPWDPSPHRHRAQSYIDLLPPGYRPDRPVTEFWGIPSPDGKDDPIPGECDSFDPARAWPGARAVRPPADPYWVLAPGSQAESRRWPVDRFAEIARRVGERTGLTCVVVGSAAEGEAAEFIRQRSGGTHVRDYTGRGLASELWALFKSARFCVSNDSGLAHIASLCGTTTLVIYGAGDPRRTRPLGPGAVMLRANPVECWPCEKNTCFQKGDLRIQCLTGIEVDGLWDDLRAGLGLGVDRPPGG